MDSTVFLHRRPAQRREVEVEAHGLTDELVKAEHPGGAVARSR